jgi:hypothetical protein
MVDEGPARIVVSGVAAGAMVTVAAVVRSMAQGSG